MSLPTLQTGREKMKKGHNKVLWQKNPFQLSYYILKPLKPTCFQQQAFVTHCMTLIIIIVTQCVTPLSYNWTITSKLNPHILLDPKSSQHYYQF